MSTKLQRIIYLEETMSNFGVAKPPSPHIVALSSTAKKKI